MARSEAWPHLERGRSILALSSACVAIDMSHHHSALIRTIFHDPINANIHWREIESLLHHVGADIEELSGNRVRVRLNRAEGVLHRPHHGKTLDRNGVRSLRGYLASAGMTPSQYEANENNSPSGQSG